MKVLNSLEGAASIAVFIGIATLIWAFLIWNDTLYRRSTVGDDDPSLQIRSKGQMLRSLAVFILGALFLVMGIRIFLIP